MIDPTDSRAHKIDQKKPRAKTVVSKIYMGKQPIKSNYDSERLGLNEIIKKFGFAALITIFAVVLIAFSSFAALAQYETSKSATFTLSSSGAANIAQSTTVGGVSIVIAGTPSATGSVSTGTYTGNPQPGAFIPADVTLTGFVAITFNMPANDFQNAIITITYTSAEVAGINPPYTIYTYNAPSNSYTALNSVVDNSAKTITVTLKSITNPLLAIGGATTPVPPSGFHHGFGYWWHLQS
jgi:hypothetical protein